MITLNAEALIWVNVIRTERLGLPPLDALPPDSCPSGTRCPIAQALGIGARTVGYVSRTTARLPNGEVVVLPHAVAAWIREHDERTKAAPPPRDVQEPLL